MTKCTGMLSNHGMMAPDFKELMLKIKKQEWANLNGQMDPPTMVIGLIIKEVEWDALNGQIKKSIMANGQIILKMDLDCLGIKLAPFIKVNIQMTKDMVMVFMFKQQRKTSKDGGMKENNMVQVSNMSMIKIKMPPNMGCGKLVLKFFGLMMTKKKKSSI